MFGHRINAELLKLAHIAYGGELYFQLKGYTLKHIPLSESKLKKTPDAVISSGEDAQLQEYRIGIFCKCVRAYQETQDCHCIPWN